jgi:hypothetical protein
MMLSRATVLFVLTLCVFAQEKKPKTGLFLGRCVDEYAFQSRDQTRYPARLSIPFLIAGKSI